VVSVIGFAMLLAGQFLARRPVIRLALLLDRQFGSLVVLVTVVGMVLYGTSFVIPQFLAMIAGYNSLQAGQIVLLSGVPMMLLMPFTPYLIRTVDTRIAVAGGLALLGFSAYMETDLSVLSDGASFIDSQLMRGLGMMMAMMFLNQAAIRSVPVEQAGDAAGLYNAARNLGGSFALAGIAVIQDQRLWLHNRRLEETLNANSTSVQDYVASQAQTLGGQAAAMRSIAVTIQRQALTMTYSDLFWILSVGVVVVMPLVLFLRPLPKGAEAVVVH